MASGGQRAPALGVFVSVVALLACGGVKTWSPREVKVPTRSLAVDETQLLAPQNGSVGQLAITANAACDRRCGPIQIDRDGSYVATLLAKRTAEPAPVPEDMRPSYTVAGKDANRDRVVLPMEDALVELKLTSSCSAQFASSKSADVIVQPSVDEKVIEVEVVCQ